MKLVAKTMEKVVIEVTANEIEKKGFEFQWDKIRRAYPATKYGVHSIGALPDNKQIIYIELVSKRLHEKE
jgi:hypothetical protein